MQIEYLEGKAPGPINPLHCIKVIDQANDHLDDHSKIEISVNNNGVIETFDPFELPSEAEAHEFIWAVCKCYYI